MKMKQIILLFISICLLSCGKSYYGYVYDHDSKVPLKGVIVDDYLNNIKTKTNSEGFFKLEQSDKISSELVFTIDGYVQDTIESIQIHGGESMEQKFKGEKIYLFSTKSIFRDSISKLNNLK
jgi:hypothetical protein